MGAAKRGGHGPSLPLSRVHVDGFRGIPSIEVELDPHTSILIGENNVGKSSLLAALELCLTPTEEPGRIFVGAGEIRGDVERAHIRIEFDEPERGAWDRPGCQPLAIAMADGAPGGRRRIALEVTATRGAGDQADVAWRFVDGAGAALAAACRPALLAALRRLKPVLVLHGGRPAIGATEARPGSAASAARAHELLAQLIDGDGEGIDAAPAGTGGDADPHAGSLRALAEATRGRFLRLARERGPTQRLVRELAERPVRLSAVGGLLPGPTEQGAGGQMLALVGLVGALLEVRGVARADSERDALLCFEDIESALHPNLLARLWSLVEAFPAQRVVTTNSGELLSWVPLGALRRLAREDGRVRAHRIRPNALSVDEKRRIAYHVRMNRAGAFFARTWILVEGETEAWIIPELARLLGHELLVEGVRCLEFAQCGITPLVKLAEALGIRWRLLADGDLAGEQYIETALRRAGQRTNGRVARMVEPDLEHLFWEHGYAEVFRRAASEHPGGRGERRARRRRGADEPRAIIGRAARVLSKPGLALSLVEAATAPGSPGVPPLLRALIEDAIADARGREA